MILKLIGILLLVCASCTLYDEGETFPDPIEIRTMHVYQSQLIGANAVLAYFFESDNDNMNFNISVRFLTTNCDLEVYRYSEGSRKTKDQVLLAYSSRSGNLDEEVTISKTLNAKYLILIREKDGRTGSFSLCAGI